jgi:hypothetical protein
MMLFSYMFILLKNAVVEELRRMNQAEITWLEVTPPPCNLIIAKGDYKGPNIRR